MLRNSDKLKTVSLSLIHKYKHVHAHTHRHMRTHFNSKKKSLHTWHIDYEQINSALEGGLFIKCLESIINI